MVCFHTWWCAGEAASIVGQFICAEFSVAVAGVQSKSEVIRYFYPRFLVRVRLRPPPLRRRSLHQGFWKLCVYVYTHICIYMYSMYTYMCTCVLLFGGDLSTQVLKHLCVYVYMFIHIYVYICIICVHICIYLYSSSAALSQPRSWNIYVHMFIHICIYIYMYV